VNQENATNGALVSSNWSYVLVSNPTDTTDTLISGNGWQLNLNEGWKIRSKNGTYDLVKE
jgi:hypothetical protein